MSAKRSQKVIDGNSHLTVYPWKHPTTGKQRWRFAYRDTAGKIKYQTHKVKADAAAAAAKIMAQTPDGLIWESLDVGAKRFLDAVHRLTPASERAAVLAFLRSRDASTDIKAAVSAYEAHKTISAGEKTPHLATVFSFLNKLAKDFKGQRVAEIHTAELAEWLDSQSRKNSSKTRHDQRGHLVAFWRWALRQGFAGSDPITAPERLPSIKVESGTRRVLSTEEVISIFKEIDEPFRAWAVLGAFAGMRPEEISPSPTKKKHKRGLHCEEIDWRFRVIRIPAEVSKVNRPRIIPMNDALIAGLKWAGIEAGMTGPTTIGNPSQTRTLSRLGKTLFDGQWPKDALRHSFGSYRNSLIRNLDQVAEEMGTSVTMLHRHYHNPQPEQFGHEWFSIRPVNPPNCSEFDPTKTEWTFKHAQDWEPEILDNSTKTA